MARHLPVANTAGECYLPFKELNKVAVFNKLEFEPNVKAGGQI